MEEELLDQIPDVLVPIKQEGKSLKKKKILDDICKHAKNVIQIFLCFCYGVQ